MHKIIILFVFFMLCLNSVSNAALPQKNYPENSLNEKKWEEISSGLDYSEEKKKEEEEKKKEKKIAPQQPISWNFGALGPILKIIGFIIIIAVIAFLIAKLIPALLYKNARVSKSPIEIESEENLEEENISEWPLQQLLNKYVSDGDMRNAIRVYYLMSLQLLHLNGYIKWEKDKTNSKYVLEFSSDPRIQDFSNLTRFYETTWYGTFIPDEAFFAVAKSQFTLFNNQFTKPDEK